MGQINFMLSVILDKYILRPPWLYPAASVQCYLCPKEFILLLPQLSGATHTHTPVCRDRWCTERSSVPVFGYRAVGQLLDLPSSPLSDSASWLGAHSYLTRQLFSCWATEPNEHLFYLASGLRAHAETHRHRGLLFDYILTSGCQDKFGLMFGLISLN